MIHMVILNGLKNDKNTNSEKKVVSYGYSDRDPALRELPSSITENGKTTYYNYESPLMNLKSIENDVKIEYNYDSFKHNITSRSIINNNQIINQNCFSYDDHGLIRDVFSENKYSIIRSDALNNIKYYENDKLLLEVSKNDNTVTKETTINNEPTISKISYDKYDRIKNAQLGDKSITYRYQDEGNPYTVGDPRRDNFSFTESPLISKLTQIQDPYENCSYNFHYNEENQLTGYDNGSSLIGVEVKQLNENEHEYKYGENKEISRRVLVENNHNYVNKKLIKTNDNYGQENTAYEYDYLYEDSFGNADDFGRLKRLIGGGRIFSDSDTKFQNTCFEYDEQSNRLKNQETVLAWLDPGMTTSRIVTDYNSNEMKESINEYVTMHNVIAEKYHHEFDEYNSQSGMGKVFKSIVYNLDELNRIKNEENSEIGLFEYFYKGNTSKLTSIKKDGRLYQKFEYIGNRLLSTNSRAVMYDQSGNIIKYKGSDIIYDARGLMTQYGENSFEYNHTGARTSKVSWNGDRSHYYLDGNKILAEYIYKEGNTIPQEYHYFYNALGIAGVKYDEKEYNFLLDGNGNVSKIFYQGRLIAEYNYDFLGNSYIKYWFPDSDEEKELVKANPFRWKGYYRDKETGFYLLGDKYYDPMVGQFLYNEGMANLESLEINGSMNNLGVIIPLHIPNNHVNIFTSIPIYSDVSSSDDSGPKWLRDIFSWYNNLHWGWKLGVGTLGLAGAIGLTALSGGTLAPIFIGMGVSVGTGAVITGAITAANGGNFWEGALAGAIDGYMWVGFLLLEVQQLEQLEEFLHTDMFVHSIRLISKPERY